METKTLRPIRLKLGFVSFFCMGLAHAGPSETWVKRLERDLEPVKGRFSVYLKHLESNFEWAFHADQPMYLSSTVKILIVAGFLKKSGVQPNALHQVVRFEREDKRDGGPWTAQWKDGRRTSWQQLIELTLIHSDNGAADKLLQHIGVSELNGLATELGFSNPQFTSFLDVRKLIWGGVSPGALGLSNLDYIKIASEKRFDRKLRIFEKLTRHRGPAFRSEHLKEAYSRYYKGPKNRATMKEMASLFQELQAGRILTKPVSSYMLNLMSRCQTGSKRLKREWRKGTWFAHKTGTQFRTACDMGVARLPSGTFIVSACGESMPLPEIEDKMGRIGSSLLHFKAE